MRYLVGNWKSNKTLEEAGDWFSGVQKIVADSETEVVICPPVAYLETISSMNNFLTSGIKLGVQDISPFPFGAYTGAIAAEMIKNWASYAIVGHSERRKYFHETHQDVANKVERCLEAGITPIVCVDEDYIDKQIAAIEDEQVKKIIIAYEPLSAIGSGVADTPEHAAQIAHVIKDKTEFDVPVLYGGSVKPENIQSFLDLGEVSGALVGGASLDSSQWMELISVAGQV